MRTNGFKLGAVALALGAALLAPTLVLAKEFYLMAAPVSVTMPDGATVQMWGYADCGGATCAGTETATVPGPPLVLTAADLAAGDTTLTVHLLNKLPVRTSLVVNGLIKKMTPVWSDGSTAGRPSLAARVRSFDAEAEPNNTADYTWSNVPAGTYLYQSGTRPQVQVQMGLYGAVAAEAPLTTATTDVPSRPQAYAGYAYDNQATLVYSEIDPVLHEAIAANAEDTRSTLDYQPKYFLINGKPFSSTTPDLVRTGNPGITLLRMLNAGLTTHVPMIQGKSWRVIAEDGKPYVYAKDQYTALLPAAKTVDVLLTPQIGGARYPVIDRRLGLSNSGQSDGGMLAFLNYLGQGVAGGSGGGTGGSSTNAAPVAGNDTYETVQGVALSVGAPQGVLVNDNDPDGQPISAVAMNGTTLGGGTYSLNANGSFTYQPAAGSTGSDSFTYQVTDGQALSAWATVTIALTKPAAPSFAVILDSFTRNPTSANTLGSNWSQLVGGTPAEPDVQVVADGTAQAAKTELGGLAIWNQASFGPKQGASMKATPLADAALVLKSTGGNVTATPANYVRVRCELNSTTNAGELVIATMMGGNNVSVYVGQAVFPTSQCEGSGLLSAAVDARGVVTAFVNGAFVGGVQLPDVPVWKGQGRIGIQVQSLGVKVDDFAGGSL